MPSAVDLNSSTTPSRQGVETLAGYARFVSRSQQRAYSNPLEIVQATALCEVAPALQRVQELVDTGLHAAGFIAYEAAPAFDDALDAFEPGEVPLVWFGLYSGPGDAPPPLPNEPVSAPTTWNALVSEDEHRRAIERIRDLIAAGDTYQVNFTFPMTAPFRGDAYAWFAQLYRAQRCDYGAYIDTGPLKILSISPELFFRLGGNTLETRPMKGTGPRGLWHEHDLIEATRLEESEKERAENLMIVDLLRNDMGRISDTGSVKVRSLFDVERYETLWQMTSTITSSTSAGVPGVLSALFPSGSVTGAPKVRTSQIIREIEGHPRGVYCGAIGWWAPGNRAEFNVAIRTVTIDEQTHTASYHVGSGITWDSNPENEYNECRLKAAILSHRTPEFELLESLLWDGQFFLLDGHLERLQNSARYFDIQVDLQAIEKALHQKMEALHQKVEALHQKVEALHQKAEGLQPHPMKVRLLVARCGKVRIETEAAKPSTPITAGFASEPVDEGNVFLYHKTTHRGHYDRLKASRPQWDDVLLWNSRGEVTESTAANLVVEIEGRRLTPPISSGLLPGVMRAHLLECGEIEEAVITKDDVRRAQSVRLVNSVRKWVDVHFVESNSC